MFKRILDEYFAFNKQQRKGLFVLACISLLLLIARLVYPTTIHPDVISVKNLPLLPIDSNTKAFGDTPHKPSKQVPETFIDDLKPKFLFPFNPNTVSESELLRLGMPKKTIKTFLKFRQKGFVFKHKEDLKKVYGVSGDLYQKLAPYIDIPIQSTAPKNAFDEKPTIKNTATNKTELNSADSLMLSKIDMLDPVMIKHLLKYRKKLGGFVAFWQLNEVFGFDEKQSKQLQRFVWIDKRKIRKLNPNQSTLYSLKMQPYVGLNAAEKIIDLRKTKTLVEADVAEIMNDPEQMKKLLPYLEFD